MLTIDEIQAKVNALKKLAAYRDGRAADVQLVRAGKIAQVYPDFFPEGVDQNVVANFIDIVARDLSEVMAPLPAINCSSANSSTPKGREFGDKRTIIASNYFKESDLQVQMYSGADRYLTYGFLPFIIEVDSERQVPSIRIENPVGSYPEFNRYGLCTAFAKYYRITIGELAAQFPESAGALLVNSDGTSNEYSQEVQMVRYYDKDQSVMYVADKKNLVLSFAKNPIGKMMVICARRPSPDEELRGQFDDVLGIQLLRNRFALLAMEAAEKAVQAPIVLPNDVVELPLGGDAAIRTAHPEGVRRLALDVPNSAFRESELLNQELRVGARYPESRTGNVNASVITGQGVQALLGAFDTQIKSFQAIMTSTLARVIGVCMEVDEKVKRFNITKTIRGVDAGAPYAIDYKPKTDIAGDYSADVRYGMLAGLNPAQGLVFMLQALGGGIISIDTVMREMPFGINVSAEQEKIDVENMRKGLISGMMAMTQSIPQMIQQGQDPSAMISKLAQGIEDRQKGKTVEEIFQVIFPAPAPVEQADGSAPVDPGIMGQQQAPQDQQQNVRPDLQTTLSRIGQGGNVNSAVAQSRSRVL